MTHDQPLPKTTGGTPAKELDPKILPYVSTGAKNETIPPREDPTGSADLTLFEEGKCDNISVNNELRADGDDEDETNSKRPKVPPT